MPRLTMPLRPSEPATRSWWTEPQTWEDWARTAAQEALRMQLSLEARRGRTIPYATTIRGDPYDSY